MASESRGISPRIKEGSLGQIQLREEAAKVWKVVWQIFATFVARFRICKIKYAYDEIHSRCKNKTTFVVDDDEKTCFAEL